MQALVSIIIPVYNLENYIENCLNSIIAQTYRNLEIICVDDGSCDRSGEIIKSMAENDSRIFYIRQENAGVSAARNNGLDNAHGDYIMFADGDDYMHFQAVEILLKTIEEKQCSMVFSKHITTPKQTEEMAEYSDYNLTEIDPDTLFENGSDRAVWNKIFKKSVISEIRFPEGFAIGEDYNYMVRVLYESGRDLGYRVDCVLYYYFVRDDSASFTRFSEKNIKEIYINEKNVEYFEDKEDCYLKYYCLLSLIRSVLYVRTKSVYSRFEKETKIVSKQIWKKWHKKFWKSNGIKLKDKILFTVFYYSRHVYEFARMIQDPTMKDFYKNRKTKRS